MSEQIPKYRTIAHFYRARVAAGVLPPGTVLKSRRKLAVEHKTSRVTIDKVIELLTAEGVLEPSDGNRPPIVADISRRTATVQNRVESAALTGRALAKNEKSEILSIEMVPCPAEFALMLGVNPGDEVLCRSRLNLVDGEPVATGYSYYPPEVTERTPELRQDASIPSGSRELAAERMGSKQAKSRNIVTSRLATDRERELLKLGGAFNVVSQITRHVTLVNGKTVEVAAKVFEGGRPVEYESSL